jgi:hypothetical protein
MGETNEVLEKKIGAVLALPNAKSRVGLYWEMKPNEQEEMLDRMPAEDQLLIRYQTLKQRPAIRDQAAFTPFEYLEGVDRARCEKRFREVLEFHGASERYDEFAARLGAYGSCDPVLALQEPTIDLKTPPWAGGPLSTSFVAFAAETAIDLLLDDDDPEKLTRDLKRARSDYEKSKPDLKAIYEGRREQSRRALAEKRVHDWSQRPAPARALFRLAEDPQWSDAAKLLRAMADAIEKEPNLARVLPPNDADQKATT